MTVFASLLFRVSFAFSSFSIMNVVKGKKKKEIKAHTSAKTSLLTTNCDERSVIITQTLFRAVAASHTFSAGTCQIFVFIAVCCSDRHGVGVGGSGVCQIKDTYERKWGERLNEKVKWLSETWTHKERQSEGEKKKR